MGTSWPSPSSWRSRTASGCGLRPAAATTLARLRAIKITTEAGTPEGSGVGGEAFRSQGICISNDYLNDPRSLAWREGAVGAGVGAAAALPLICGGRSIGVLLVTRSGAGTLDEAMVSLFERMSSNISHALENFARETARLDGERAVRRLNRMFGALTATNEAILHASTEQDLYQRVCDAAVYSGKSLGTFVLLHEPDSQWLTPVAATGQNLDLIRQARYSIDPESPDGKGISGEVFRTQKAIVEDDLVNRTKGTTREQANVNAGAVACVAAPLIKRGTSIGVLFFFVSKAWAKDEGIVALLLRMTETVCFALENFDRDKEKAQIALEEERLARMYAALSATNEAILRARSRSELFDLVCEATVQGAKFASTSIALLDRDAGLLRVVASFGPNAEEVRSFRLSVSDKVPEGRGLTGTAFRTRRPCISNDVLADTRLKPWHASARRNGIRVVDRDAAVQRRQGRRRIPVQFAASAALSRTNSSSCCASSRPTSPSRWRISTGPTRRRKADKQRDQVEWHVRGAERNERGYHARQDARGTVRRARARPPCSAACSPLRQSAFWTTNANSSAWSP